MSDGHRRLRAAAEVLSADEVTRHRQYPDLWASSVLDRDPTGSELLRAELVLRLRAKETGPQLPSIGAPPALPRPPGPGVTFPCARCRKDRPADWTGQAWAVPAPCSGNACGYFADLLEAAPPELPALEAAIGLCVDQVQAFELADPVWAAQFRALLGTFEYSRRVLEWIAQNGAGDAREAAWRALELHQAPDPVAFAPQPVRYELAGPDDDGHSLPDLDAAVEDEARIDFYDGDNSDSTV